MKKRFASITWTSLWVTVCTIMTLVGVPTLFTANAATLQEVTQANQSFLQVVQNPAGAFTTKTRIKLTAELENTFDGIWMAGIQDQSAANPFALALTWSPIANGWFGPAWGFQLATNQGLIPDALTPKHTDGFLAGCDYINLATASPEWNHEYEATLGFTPQSGWVSISVTDITTREVIVRQSLQLKPYSAKVYPMAGIRYKPSVALVPGAIQSIDVVDYNLPLGISWWVTQQTTPNAYSIVDTVDRRKSAAIMLRLPWQKLPGELQVMLEGPSQSTNLLTIPQPEDNQSHVINLAGITPGKYSLLLRYLENGQSWDLDRRDITIGQISLAINNLTLSYSSSQEPVISGNLLVESDGPIGNVVSGIELGLTKHTFNPNNGAGTGNIRTTEANANLVINQQILNLNQATLVTLPFQSTVPLPADAANYVWQVTARPFSLPATIATGISQQSVWLGKPFVPQAWVGYLLQEKQTKMAVAPGVDAYQISGSIAAGPLKMFLLEVDLNQPGITIDGLAGRDLSSGSKVRWPRSQVSSLIAQTGAIAGVNSSFFEISSTMVPSSMLINSYNALRTPGTAKRGILGVTDNNKAYIGEWRFAGEVRGSLQPVALTGINPPAIAANEAGLYRAPWLSSPGFKSSEVGGAANVVELVLQDTTQITPGVMRGRVAEVRQNQPGIPLGTTKMVITARDTAAVQLAQYHVGDELEISYRISGTSEWPWLPATDTLRAAASGGVILVKNGIYGDNAVVTDSARHPRTAAAISTDRSKLYLMVVDGRSTTSVGMTYKEMADYFLRMGAFEALNLDGGGSSTFSVRLQPTGKVSHLNTPSDGSERYVADGIGVFYKAPQN